MAYTVNVDNAGSPLDADSANQAAQELRAIKTKLNAVKLVADTATVVSSTVALLPAGVNGKLAYAANGRKVGEAATAGTGVIVYFSNTQWRVLSTDAVVAI